MARYPLKAILMLGLRSTPLMLGKRRSNVCLSLVIVSGIYDGLRADYDLSSPFTRVRITDESAY